ncbi:hypothetical protein J1N35_041685 [Gossypium stocksii]|uniref:Uncharacterized protein n=1 Tax=Gossypium stocksii TaxID=47602 RepID=A0A9D3ZJI3_9ROSI|nr:hypothetical protein J1N35_041685 [Gossypium stocksii]
MAHPNENFPFNLSLGQVGASGSRSQPNEADLFAGWFIDLPENFNNAAYQGVSHPLDLNISTAHGLPLSPNQEASSQQFLALQEQMKFMNNQMAAKEARFKTKLRACMQENGKKDGRVATGRESIAP